MCGFLGDIVIYCTEDSCCQRSWLSSSMQSSNVKRVGFLLMKSLIALKTVDVRDRDRDIASPVVYNVGFLPVACNS